MFTNTSVAKNYVTVLRTKVTVARLVWHMPTHVNTSDEDRTCHMYICTCVYFACPLNEWKSSNEFSHSFDFFWFCFCFRFFFVCFFIEVAVKTMNSARFLQLQQFAWMRPCVHACACVCVYRCALRKSTTYHLFNGRKSRAAIRFPRWQLVENQRTYRAPFVTVAKSEFL